MHPAFRGRGYTTRALRLLVGWAFDACDWPDWNSDGTFSDEVRYALINPKYA